MNEFLIIGLVAIGFIFILIWAVKKVWNYCTREGGKN